MKVGKLLTILEENIYPTIYPRRIKLSKRVFETDKHPRHRRGESDPPKDYYQFKDKIFKNIFEVIEIIREEPWSMTLNSEDLSFEPVDHNLLSHSDVVIYEGDFTEDEANFIDYFIQLTNNKYKDEIDNAKSKVFPFPKKVKPKIEVD